MMMHGPCGEDNPSFPCMKTRNRVTGCSKKFPRLFSEATVVPENGYPQYRRRNNGVFITKTIPAGNGTPARTVWLDNRHIIPYNPYLSYKYNAHINVKICASIKVVKYLNKYIYKGTDLATLALNNANSDDSNDEVTTHINCRYLCPAECTVRVNEWHTHCKKPHVIRLGVHLENAQLIYFPVCQMNLKT